MEESGNHELKGCLNGITLLSILVMLAGCTFLSTPESSSSVDLEWEMLVASEEVGNNYSYQGLEPKMVGITDAKSADALTYELQPIHSQTLKGINFGEDIAIVIYQGQKATLGYSIDIDNVQFHGQEIIVNTRFLQPDQNWLENVTTSPYYILRIKKESQLTGNLFLVLTDGEKEVFRTEFFIP